MARAHRRSSPANSTLARGEEFVDDFLSFRGARGGKRLNAGRDNDRIVAAGIEGVADVEHFLRRDFMLLREPLDAVLFVYVFERNINRRDAAHEYFEFGERLFQRLPEKLPFRAVRVPRIFYGLRRINADVCIGYL